MVVLFYIKSWGPTCHFRHAGRFENHSFASLIKVWGHNTSNRTIEHYNVNCAACGCFCCSSFSIVPSIFCTPASMSVNNFIATLIFHWKTSFAKVLALSSLFRFLFEESRLYDIPESVNRSYHTSKQLVIF